MKPGYWVMVGVFIFLVGLAVGRFAIPAKIVQKDSKEQAEVIAKLRREITSLKSNVVKETTTDYSPSTGRPMKKVAKVSAQTDKHVDLSVQGRSIKTVVETKTVEITKAAPMNRLGVSGSIDSRGTWTVGPEYQRRIAGPFSVGVRAEVSPSNPKEFRFGAGVSLEF